MATDNSEHAYQHACQYMPGGVNSPVRSFRAVGGTPRFLQEGRGATMVDIDGNEYIDYVASWGPLILGHAHPAVVDAVVAAAQRGLTFGAPTESETQLAQCICRAFESIDQVRLVNSGTEAVTSAIRLARACTRRDKIIKAAGGYHGHVDQLLVQAGSGVATLGLPSSDGVPDHLAQMTVVVPFNDLDAVDRAFEQFREQIAAVLIEPVAGNMGVVPPQDGYLHGLRTRCDEHGAMLIFDEVITGFRVAFGGAQQRYNVRADLTCLGKIIGGGLPVGAYGGRRELMQRLAPLGPVYQAGTLSGNPLATAAGLATLNTLKTPGTYERLDELANMLATGLRDAASQCNIPVTVNHVASMMTLFFTDRPVTNYDDAQHADGDQYKRFFHLMLDRGVYLPPSPFEAMFVSAAHTPHNVKYTIEQARKSFDLLTDQG